jgi:IS5 family transposase
MDRVVPWAELVALIEQHSPRAKTGRPPFPIETMLGIHFLQQRFGMSESPMEEAFFDVPMYREFAQLPDGVVRLPEESTILRFRHLLEKHGLAAQMFAAVNATLGAKGLMLKTGTAVDATIIAAPSSTNNKTGERDPEMRQTKQGNQWHFGMKAHIGVDAGAGLVHTGIGTAANVNDVTQAGALLHGQETAAFGDAGYRGVHKRQEIQWPTWFVAMQPGKRKALDTNRKWARLLEKAEQHKASVRAKVEHPFRVVKQQFGHAKVRYRGLAKNTARLTMLFALSNLWMARRHVLGSRG